MLISAALIVRDEEKHLGECLAALHGHVDEIVVVDTGSIDASPQIAKEAGAVVVHRPWDADFAAARNAGLAIARGDWILYIDADERFSVDGDLSTALSPPDVVAGLVRFRAAQGYTPYLEHRLFRNRPDIRFRGAMHETILPDIERLVADERLRAVPVPAAIEHLGYDGDQTAKHHRNLPLLERAVVDDPRRPYLWYHLGAVRHALGDEAGAEAAWSRAVELARESGGVSAPAALAYVELALHRIRRRRSAADLLRDLEVHRPRDPLTVWVAGNQALFDRRWSDGVVHFERLLAVDARDLATRELGYNAALFEAFSAHGLGNCWFQLGEYERAAAAYARAEAADPTNAEYRAKAALARARATGR